MDDQTPSTAPPIAREAAGPSRAERAERLRAARARDAAADVVPAGLARPDVGRAYCDSPLGLVEVVAAADGITAVAFVAARDTGRSANATAEAAARQLDAYFAGTLRVFDVPVRLPGTELQRAVWMHLCTIPYGRTVTYGDVARAVGRPSAVRAVGAAVGRNPIWLIVPCHRVVGARGALTGYAAGLWRKAWLLRHEGALLV